MEEIITGGWLEGEIIRDGVVIDSESDQPAFEDIRTNANVVRELRECGLVGMVSE